MKYNTRFNPTISGPLHIGHLYMALVNEAEAHRTGGKFIIRVDDTQDVWNHWIKKDERDKYYEDYQEQLGVFMDVDVWERQSQMLTPEEIMGDTPLLKCLPAAQFSGPAPIIEWREDINQRVFQYDLTLVVEKVIWDYHQKVSLLIRGDDLITEAQLYEHLTSVLRIPKVHQIYLPKLMSSNLQDDIRTYISKFERIYKLETQIDTLGVKDILYWLRQSCLKCPDGDFLVDNIKSNPIAKGFKA